MSGEIIMYHNLAGNIKEKEGGFMVVLYKAAYGIDEGGQTGGQVGGQVGTIGGPIGGAMGGIIR
jgi:hypothetical protein